MYVKNLVTPYCYFVKMMGLPLTYIPKISTAQNFGYEVLSLVSYLKDNPEESRLPVDVPANISNMSSICILLIVYPTYKNSTTG